MLLSVFGQFPFRIWGDNLTFLCMNVTWSTANISKCKSSDPEADERMQFYN